MRVAPLEGPPRPQDLAPSPGKHSGLKGARGALPAPQGRSCPSPSPAGRCHLQGICSVLEIFYLTAEAGRKLKGSCVRLGFFQYKYDRSALEEEKLETERVPSPSQTAHSASPCFGQSVFESKHAEEKPPLSRTIKHRGSCRRLGFPWNFSFNTRCTNSPGAAGAPSPPTVPPPWPLPWSVCEAYFKEKMHPEGALAQERCSLLHDKP